MRGATVLLLLPLAVAAHYEDPKDGCGSDEQAVRIQGISGDFCSPACKGMACPTDPPSASDAKPQCALQSPTGSKYCALVCSPGDNGACPEGASCQPIQGTGICTYPAGGGELAETVVMPGEAQVTLPSPADIEKLICVVASQKQTEDKAVEEICQVITEKFPNIKFNPDCKTDVEAVWDAAVAKCPQAKVTLPSPADIEKLICQVATQKQIEDKAVEEICQVITEKFPNIKFNPDCKTDVEAVWDAAVAKCPQAKVTLPSPADIEKLVCDVATQKQIEDKAVEEICQVTTEKFPSIKFNPDCKTDVEAVWDAAVAKCPQAKVTLFDSILV